MNNDNLLHTKHHYNQRLLGLCGGSGRGILSRVQLITTPQPARLLCPWDFPGKNTGVGCQFLLQGIFLTQGSNPGLLLGRLFLTPEPPGRGSTWRTGPKIEVPARNSQDRT